MNPQQKTACSKQSTAAARQPQHNQTNSSKATPKANNNQKSTSQTQPNPKESQTQPTDRQNQLNSSAERKINKEEGDVEPEAQPQPQNNYCKLLPNKPDLQVVDPLTTKKPLVIGSYRVTKTLGQGTFGKVKEGIHVFTNQKVAIKILEKDKIGEVNDVERVSREIHILKIVRHPHIVQLYEIIETPNRLFLIMEHCCNGELFSYITSKNRLKEEEACRLFQQLISAINYLGQLGIVHRDVKPENLLLDEQLNLKMVDFGLSNTYRDGEKLSTACGSPCYAAPELIKGLEYIGQKADIWSAGVVLYTLLCGHLPFEDSNTQSLYQKILNARYKITCNLSKEARGLIENILVPDPNLRYGLKQIISNQWFKTRHPMHNLQLDSHLVESKDYQERYTLELDEVLTNVLSTMGKDELNKIDIIYVKMCLEARTHNALTSYYYLLAKRMRIQGEPLMLDTPASPAAASQDEPLIPKEKDIKRYQSIEPVRSTMVDQKGHALQKAGEGKNDINLNKIQAVQSPLMLSPVLPQQRFAFSPDQLLIQPDTESHLALISPTFVQDQTIYFPVNNNGLQQIEQTSTKNGANQQPSTIEVFNKQIQGGNFQTNQEPLTLYPNFLPLEQQSNNQPSNVSNNNHGGRNKKRPFMTIQANPSAKGAPPGLISPNQVQFANIKPQKGQNVHNQQPYTTKRADTIISDYCGPATDLISPLASTANPNQSHNSHSQRKEKTKFKKAAPAQQNSQFTNNGPQIMYPSTSKNAKQNSSNSGSNGGYGAAIHLNSIQHAQLLNASLQTQNSSHIRQSSTQNPSSTMHSHHHQQNQHHSLNAHHHQHQPPQSLLEKEIRRLMNQSQVIEREAIQSYRQRNTQSQASNYHSQHNSANKSNTKTLQQNNALSNQNNGSSGVGVRGGHKPHLSKQNVRVAVNNNNSSNDHSHIEKGKLIAGKQQIVNSNQLPPQGPNHTQQPQAAYLQKQHQLISPQHQFQQHQFNQHQQNQNHQQRKGSMGVLSPASRSSLTQEQNALVFSGSQLQTLNPKNNNQLGSHQIDSNSNPKTTIVSTTGVGGLVVANQNNTSSLSKQAQYQQTSQYQTMQLQTQPATGGSQELGNTLSDNDSQQKLKKQPHSNDVGVRSMKHQQVANTNNPHNLNSNNNNNPHSNYTSQQQHYKQYNQNSNNNSFVANNNNSNISNNNNNNNNNNYRGNSQQNNKNSNNNSSSVNNNNGLPATGFNNQQNQNNQQTAPHQTMSPFSMVQSPVAGDQQSIIRQDPFAPPPVVLSNSATNNPNLQTTPASNKLFGQHSQPPMMKQTNTQKVQGGQGCLGLGIGNGSNGGNNGGNSSAAQQIKDGSRKYLQSNKKKVDKKRNQNSNTATHRPSLEQFSNVMAGGNVGTGAGNIGVNNQNSSNLSALGRTTTIARGKLNEMLSMAVSTTTNGIGLNNSSANNGNAATTTSNIPTTPGNNTANIGSISIGNQRNVHARAVSSMGPAPASVTSPLANSLDVTKNQNSNGAPPSRQKRVNMNMTASLTGGTGQAAGGSKRLQSQEVRGSKVLASGAAMDLEDVADGKSRQQQQNQTANNYPVKVGNKSQLRKAAQQQMNMTQVISGGAGTASGLSTSMHQQQQQQQITTGMGGAIAGGAGVGGAALDTTISATDQMKNVRANFLATADLKSQIRASKRRQGAGSTVTGGSSTLGGGGAQGSGAMRQRNNLSTLH